MIFSKLLQKDYFKKRKQSLTANKHKAFSLAETLIVLVVFAIIFSIAFPPLIRSNREQINVLKVRKLYRELSTAYRYYLLYNYNYIDFSDYPNTEAGAKKVYEDLIKPYFKISQDAGTSQEEKQKIMPENNITFLSGGTHSSNYCSSKKYYAVKFRDGSVLAMRGKGNQSGIFFIYYTRGKKGDNVFGKDVFCFSINPSSPDEISPHGDVTEKLSIKEAAMSGCINNRGNSFHCAAWVIAKGNTDYLHCPNTISWEKGRCK